MGAKSAQAADAAKATQQVQQTEGVKKAQSVQHVENVQKSEKAQLKRIKRDTTVNEKPGLDKTTQGLANLLEDIEKGQGVMDKLIKAASRGRDFSNSELISLQAGMYKYTQELELTGKVVEKATSGLKDTLKTQV